MEPVTAVLSLGANLHDPRRQLAEAVVALKGHPQILTVQASPLARTTPVGPVEQPDFLNQTLIITTTLSAEELLAFGHDLEARAHRRREVRWGPRTLDVDVIDYDQQHRADPQLTLPHPRAHERGFVLVPWSWIDPDATLDGTPITELIQAATDADEVHRL
ncbi:MULTISPECIES: 2-amino-4-hydroxy-6-hydroxymethyldihydropteridine diphosphokinase [Auritidibacter]|uniref:2-amino-4-hydroxy-6-hydroxymethyldihydropteridine diphosphokinase n=1 Tax=Auritidibacter ignavus TaxID=678932 RepID=A0AAJ6ALX5_9MICC|nr:MULTISPECIES: 2-amino-4-hydroxy-6-hydroxymethyldihydropteridine diphosphokinase [Auritidibacter]NIH72580.1 2-amino-4-hydroxy-6-hydroxymethyldihydropteridine diphosphokinase [Auritidibacter ignavus]PXA79038.1 2-amino-4-hydroxy-6-hydroxymethyldihydropteridine diphosphokinase [Auritidibacter sp. NML120636]RMX22614.1 2-amino-4-hydroxy-6-hydroxymethyldihydropteridine diphosphokinase [Auritidibacter ignavus]WGH92381.1 2-amino-4-hydroxy-6-hydroxymethyldihydropteridine diphosphokinase [Auritidibacte